MNTFARSLRLAASSALVWGCLGSLPTTAADRKLEGEKIKFSSPASTSLMRPVTEREFDQRGLSLPEARSSEPANNLPTGLGMSVSGQEQVNRAQAIQQLLELGGAMNGTSLWEGESSASDDPLRPKGAETRLSIDDLFERPSSSSRDRGRSEEDLSLRLDSGLDGTSSRRNDPGRRGDLDASSMDGLGDGRAQGRLTDDPRERSFLPGFDSTIGFSGSRRGGRSDNFLGLGTATGAAWTKAREDDERRARTERMDSFRRLLGSSGSSGSGLTDLLGSGPGRSGAGSVTAPSGPGAGRSGSMELSPTVSSVGAEPQAVNRNLPTTARPAQLDLTIGQNRNLTRRQLEDLAPPPPPPLELLRQKHDTRLPVRPF